MPLNSCSDASCFLRCKRLVQRRRRMSAEIVADQHQPLGIWIMLITDRAKHPREIDARLSLSHFHVPLSGKRLKCHEQIGDAAPQILAVLSGGPARAHRQRRTHIIEQDLCSTDLRGGMCASANEPVQVVPLITAESYFNLR